MRSASLGAVLLLGGAVAACNAEVSPSEQNAPAASEAEQNKSKAHPSHACTKPWPGGAGTFNPACVYLFGTLYEGIGGLEAIVHPSQPDTIFAGFGSNVENAQIRATDGRLVFEELDKLYVFHDDALGGASPHTVISGVSYPSSPLANDEVLATHGCDSLANGAGWITLGGIFPDDGAPFYGCYDGTVYLAGTSPSPLPLGNRIVAPGAGRSLLIRSGLTELSVHLSAGHDLPVHGLPQFDTVVARFIDDHFIVALFKDMTMAERWHVALDGKAVRIGAYPFDGNGPLINWDLAKLDGEGALFAFTRVGVPSIDQVARFAVGSPPAVVYDETGKKVKIHISHLVTGG